MTDNKTENNTSMCTSTEDSLLIKYTNYCKSNYNFQDDEILNNLFILISGDSSAYNKIQPDLNRLMNNTQMETIKNLKPLDSIDCDEAYRFSLWRAFCCLELNELISGQVIITVYKKLEVVKLNYFITSISYDKHDSLYQEPIYSIHDYKVVTLNKKDWQELKNKIEESYFWSLFPYEKKNIIDGSSWLIEGYIERNKNHKEKSHKKHMVIRRSPPKCSFYELGNTFVKLSKQDIGPLY